MTLNLHECREASDADRHPTKYSLADFYLRTIYHTQCHIRQIWLLRGALGMASGPWPDQHWG